MDFLRNIKDVEQQTQHQSLQGQETSK
jgi:hypothetical protein